MLIFLPADLTIKIDSTKDWDVVDPGVGNVERNIVVNIMILKQGNSYLQQKIITMIHVVGMKKASKKRTIVGEGVQGTVPGGGRLALVELPGEAGKATALEEGGCKALNCCSRF